MTAHPYTRLDAAYLLGALDADERLAYEAYLAICRRCGPAFAAGRDGPDESGKVAGVVDAMDGGKSAAVPLDLVNAGRAEIQPVNGAKRDAESPAQQDLYRGNVTYHQDGPAAVVSSPLQRAVDTAAIAAAELGLTAVIDDDLRETDFGDWDGFTLAEIQQRWPAAAAAWRRDPEQAPPGGESFADTAHRVNRACDRLLRDHGGQTVLVVSHVTPIKILLCRALGVPLGTLYRLYLGSACISEIQWHGCGFAAVHRVNDTSHLP